MDEIKNIKDFALMNGVDIIMEIDIPGHAASWEDGQPSLIADCTSKYTNVNNIALNPTLDATYDVIEAILSDIVTAMDPKYIHTGGDEVVYGCWSNDASITSFMADQGISSYNALLGYFVDNVDDIVSSFNVTSIHWEEVFTAMNAAGKPASLKDIFQVWTESSMVSSITSAGYLTIASPSDQWYLDNKTCTWQTMYAYDPATDLSEAQQAKLIGGEVTMWGEYVDETNLLSSIYPRACSVAERLWSPETVTDLTDAKERLLIQRCRLIQRGFPSAPVQPGYCDTHYL